MIRLLQEMVRIPSVSGSEGAVADHVSAALAALGFDVQRSVHNLYFDAFQGTGPTLLFNSHLDTVPACGSWTQDPLGGVLENGRLYGLGANDAGGCVVALVSAAARLRDLDRESPLGGTLRVALTTEEETTGAGILSVLPLFSAPDAAIVGEPTRCRAVLAQKGLLILRGVAHGVAGHAAHGETGGARNAIHSAARAITALAEAVPGPAHPLLGPPSVQVTMIEGGHARNAVPDECEFWVDVRTNPGTSHPEIHARLQGLSECELVIHSSRLMAVETDAAQPIARAAVLASGAPPEGSRTTSDWVGLSHVPTVKIGPGDTARSHRADEYLDESELDQGVRVYTDLARSYFALAREGAASCR